MRHRAPRNLLALLRLRWRRPRRRATAGTPAHPGLRLAGAVAAALVLLTGTVVAAGQLGGEEVPTGTDRTYPDRRTTDEPSRSSDRTPVPTPEPSAAPSAPPAPEPRPEPESKPAPPTTPDTPVEEPTPTTPTEQPTATETPSPLDLPSAQVSAGGLSTPDLPSPTAATGSASLTPSSGDSSPDSDEPSPTQDDSSPTRSPDHDPPQTTIVSGPSATEGSGWEDDSRFVFDADESATFECRLDDRAFRPCDSPQEYDGLDAGRHEFAVRAIDGAGNVDPTPDTYSWVTTGLTG